MVKINVQRGSLQEQLELIFRQIEAAETNEERLDMIDRGWYEVWGMKQIIEKGVPFNVGQEERLDYWNIRAVLENALKRLEDMFDYACDHSGE